MENRKWFVSTTTSKELEGLNAMQIAVYMAVKSFAGRKTKKLLLI